jgi:tetratricopeptide (TPR) repeat protein
MPSGKLQRRVAFAKVGVLILFLAAISLRAASPEVAFEQANQLYERGQFAEAVATYETLVRAGTSSPAVFFNLGNAHFKAGHLGQALVNYRRADDLAPRDPDIRANLHFARNSVPGANLRPVNRWGRWLPRLTLNETAFLAASAVWLWLSLLTLGQLRPALRKPLRVATRLAGLTVVLAAALAWANWEARRGTVTAIVVVPEATVRVGPLDESQSAFTVRDGLELEVVDTKDDWLRVTDASRRMGWLKREQAAVFPVPTGRATGR